MDAGQRIAATYGSNMLGSAVGAAVAPAVTLLIRPELLPAAMAAPALLGVAGLLVRGFDRRSAVAALALVAIGLGLSLQPIALRPDPYKYART